MEFAPEYFEDQVRDEFYIPSLMKRCWAATLEILDDIDKVCKENDIQWFLFYGSLLGAVRHKGFIPWDDDLDIAMMRKDYERFLEVAPSVLPSYYRISNVYNSEKFNDLISNVNYSAAMPLSGELVDKYKGFPFITGVDIFPIDAVADDEEEEKRRKVYAREMAALSNAIKAGEADPQALEDEIRMFEVVHRVKIGRGMKAYHNLYRMMDELFAETRGQKTRLVAECARWLFVDDHFYDAEWFDGTSMLEFEGRMTPVPKDWESVVRRIYGPNYNTPVRVKYGHGYPHYSEQEVFFKENYQLSYQYKFEPEKLTQSRVPYERILPDVKAREYLDLLKRLDACLNFVLTERNSKLILQVLEQCQRAALSMGNDLEENAARIEPLVTLLEQYCEKAYSIFEKVQESGIMDQNEPEMADHAADMDTMLVTLDSQIAGIRRLRHIVFVPFKATAWDTMIPLWQQYMSDPEWCVHVVPIPYYHRNSDGEPIDPHYEASAFPQEAAVQSYREMNLQEMHPDVIVNQYPYDNYNMGLVVPAQYFTEPMKAACDRLIYIPWAKMEDADIDNPFHACDITNLHHLVEMPGVVLADEIYVASAILQHTYVEMLTKFCGEDTREHWMECVKFLPANEEMV